MFLFTNLSLSATNISSDLKNKGSEKGKVTEPRLLKLKNRVAVISPNVRMHPSATTNQSEISIATHPTNPNIVLAGWNSNDTSGAFQSQGWSYTTDGGQNWVGGDTIPTHSPLSLGMFDPAVGIDLDGNLFFSALYFQHDLSELLFFVSKSINNGASWSENILSNPESVHDKNHLAIDLNPASPFANYLYTAYTDFGLTGWPLMFTRSTDKGVNFSLPLKISGSVGSALAQGVNLAVAPDSVLYAAWSGYDVLSFSTSHLGFNKSTNGGASWGTALSIRTLKDIRGALNKGGNFVRVASFPSMAVDRSNGPRRGWIYIVQAEKAPTTPDIFLVRSTDGGVSWSAPRKVNQDVSGKDQWFPWISVDPITGALYVIYFDSRNFPANDSAQVYISSSLDGGETFEDILVSEVPFLPTRIPNPAVGFSTYMGDYIGLAALNGIVWPCWYDNRTGVFQAYTSRIEFIEVGVGPRISVTPETLNFGDVIGGALETLSVSVRNLGFPETLLVTNIQSDSAEFTPEITALTLPGASSQQVKIAFNPSHHGLVSATLMITSSDTTNPIDTIQLLGNGLFCFSKPGDANGSGGNPNLTDIIYLVNYVFKGGPAPNPICSGDANASGGNPNLTDIIYLVNYVFKGGTKPVAIGVCCL